jgi:hypothetical protein
MFGLKPAKSKFKNQNTSQQQILVFSNTINKSFLKEYTAYLSPNKIYVKDEAEACGLYKLGCFGKSEFSRSEPILNNISRTSDNMSLELEDIPPISKEAYSRKMEWSNLYKNKVFQNQANDFHANFLAEYVANNIKPLKSTEPRKKCRINIVATDTKQPDMPINRQNEINPFKFVITNTPDCVSIENLCLSYEEAFYLSYALGCLRILDAKDNAVLKNIDLWNIFAQRDKQFISKYIVYHKLR